MRVCVHVHEEVQCAGATGQRRQLASVASGAVSRKGSTSDMGGVLLLMSR